MVMEIDVGSEEVKMYWGGVYWMLIIMLLFFAKIKGNIVLGKDDARGTFYRSPLARLGRQRALGGSVGKCGLVAILP